jgi:hypothetical protein
MAKAPGIRLAESIRRVPGLTGMVFRYKFDREAGLSMADR